jgi:hypothetical protein
MKLMLNVGDRLLEPHKVIIQQCTAKSVQSASLRRVGATPPGAGPGPDPGAAGQPIDSFSRLDPLQSAALNQTAEVEPRYPKLTGMLGGHHAPLLGREGAQHGKRATSNLR